MARGKGRTKKEKEAILRSLKPLLERGTSTLKACEYLGISYSTVTDYILKYEWFAMEIKQYKARRLIEAETLLMDAMMKNKDVSTAKWLLERIDKNRYSTKNNTEISGTVNIALPVDLLDSASKKRLEDNL